MPDEAAAGEKSTPVLRTLADKVNWLIDRAHPAGRGPFSNNEIAALIKDATGEEVSYTTIWKLRNGQAQNPQKRLIEALAKTFGVPPAFFFDDYDEQAGLLQEQVELLALVRDARISSAQLRAHPRAQPASPAGHRQPGRGHGTRRHAQAAQRARRSRLNYPPSWHVILGDGQAVPPAPRCDVMTASDPRARADPASVSR